MQSVDRNYFLYNLGIPNVVLYGRPYLIIIKKWYNATALAISSNTSSQNLGYFNHFAIPRFN
jgi:hypothetical protein